MSNFFAWMAQNPIILRTLVIGLIIYLVIQVMYTVIYVTASASGSPTRMTSPVIPFMMFTCVGIPATFIGLLLIYFTQLIAI